MVAPLLAKLAVSQAELITSLMDNATLIKRLTGSGRSRGGSTTGGGSGSGSDNASRGSGTSEGGGNTSAGGGSGSGSGGGSGVSRGNDNTLKRFVFFLVNKNLPYFVRFSPDLACGQC